MSQLSSVLIIDDNEQALGALSILLSHGLGVSQVRESRSAEHALEILGSERFDVIISDYQLEGMDGVEFLETLRNQGNQTPIILLSGAPDRAGVLKAVRQPKVDFLGKPFQVFELSAAMERLQQAA